MEEHEIHHTGSNLLFLLHPLRYWTHQGQKQCVNFIGRVENFENDFLRLVSSWSLPVYDMSVNENTSGDIAASANAYRHLERMNHVSIDRLNELFSDDFELFGYEKVKTASRSNKKFMALPSVSLWRRGRNPD